MKNNILECIDFRKIDTLLKGFKKTTGIAIAIGDLEGVILSQYEWRKLQNDFYFNNPETSNWSTNIKIELTKVEKFQFHKYLNGLAEVTIPIVLNNEHFVNILSGYFFFEKPDLQFFKEEAKQYGFDEKKYIDAINILPVFSLKEIQNTMTFLIETLHYIFEMASDKKKQLDLTDSLSTNKLFLENIIDNSPALIYVSDLDGKIKLANNEFGQIFQLDKTEIVGKYRQEIMPKEIAEQHRNNDIDVIQLKKSIISEEENMETDGKHFYISQKFPLFDTKGVIQGVGGISTDITAKKRAEEALIKSEIKYKSLFNNSVDGILVLNEQSEILELNNKICEILDYSREELVLLKRYQFIHSEDFANKDHTIALEELQQGKTIISQYRLRRKDGSYIPTELSTKMIAEGQFLNIVRDITERIEAEKTLQESEKKLSAIFNNHTDLQVLASIKNQNEYTVDAINNPYISTLASLGINVTIDAIIGKPLSQLNEIIGLNEDYYESTIAKYKEVARTGKSLNFTENLDIAGQIYTSEITIIPIMNDHGVCEYILYNSHNITEQKRVNRALIESEEKFKKIFLTSPDIVTISQIEDGIYVDVNENFIQISGYSQEEIIGKTSTDINIWHDLEDRNRMVSKLKECGKVENFEAQFTLKNGRIIEGLLSGALITINNKPHILTITRDITEFKLTEQAYKETAANLRSMIDNREDSIYSIDRDFNYIIFNSTFENIINNQYNIKLKKGMSSIDQLTEEQANFWVPKFKAAFEGESDTFEFNLTINDETQYFQSTINPIVEDHLITGASGISIDITKRKLIEEALKLSEEKFEKTFRLSPYLISLTNMEGQVFDVNDRVISTLGYTRDEFLGNKTTELPLWVNLKERENFTNLLTKDESVHNIEVQLRKKSGEIGDYLLSACIIEVNKKKVFLNIVHDISLRKNAEKEIIKLNNDLELKVKQRTAQLEDMNKELATFTYSVSHDLKAPLRGIDGYSKLLADIYKSDLTDEAQSFIEKIRTSTLQMNQIIDDLLEYSRLERSQLHIGKIKIKELIESVLSSYDEEFKAGYFKVNIKIPNFEIDADAKGFVIAFRNLIENAIKFKKEKTNPTIIIKIEEKELSWIISVNDNGIGFDMKYHHKIFDIFQRLQRVEDFPGTGIGLALVSKAMHRMNGKTWAESKPNVGSTFYLEIPKNQ
ncbi:PAS domain S-box protein [Flavobacterium ovatum]|uniref:PAS domain S-box protein n=1 Tax=Flavobacterium ovatum TaxID=1928857 RepID=UPI003450C40D